MVGVESRWLQVTHVSACTEEFGPDAPVRRIVPAITCLTVTDGVLEASANGRIVTAQAGETLICRPGIVYSLKARRMLRTGTDTVNCLCAEVMFLLSGEYAPDEVLVMPGKLGVSQSARLAQTVRELIDLFQMSTLPPLQQLARQTSLACEIVQCIVKESELAPETPGASADSNLVQRVSAFCRRKLSSGVTVDDMVAEAHMSRSAFFACLKASIGISPAQLLKKIRLERGLTLLRQTEKSMAQIADDVGFADQFHFAREFKRSYGLTPSRYRKTHHLPATDAGGMSAADALFDATRYRQAAQAYAEVREEHAGSDLAMRACYRQGLSHFLDGAPERAFEVWQAVQGTRFQHSVELRRCRHLFDTGQHAEVIDLLGGLCRSETNAVRDEALGQWSGYVEALLRQEKVAALHEYLALRKRAFPRDPVTNLTAAKALFATGRYMDVPDQCPDLKQCISALRAAGRFDEILKKYVDSPYSVQLAQTLYSMGAYERLLQQYPDMPSICVEALVQLGRPEEAVARYPGACASALFAMKRYDEVLEKCPEDSTYRVRALRGLGRTDDALEECKGDTWLRQHTLLFLGRCREVLDEKIPDAVGLRQTAVAIQGVQMFEEGRFDEGLGRIESLPWIGSKDFYWDHTDPFLQLLAPLVRSMRGQKDAMGSRCREIVDRFRYCFSQYLWHDAAFILGEIDSEGYLKQPLQLDVEPRLAFARGMRADYLGRCEEALPFYRRSLEFRRGVWNDPLRMHFFRWRAAQHGRA